MTIAELTSYCNDCIINEGFITLSSEVLTRLDLTFAEHIQRQFGGRTLMMLPEHEVSFFDWLKENDYTVWSDLWDSDTDAPYLVSLSYLPEFIGERPGVFHIRDLRTTDNYYFAPEMILAKESTAFLGAVNELFLQKRALTPAQLLALEASNGPVDIWHLAYRRNVPVDALKKAVVQLVDDHVLVHVPDADHLATIFDVQ